MSFMGEDNRPVVIWIIEIEKCPYCHEDHGEVEFMGRDGDDHLTGLCKSGLGVIHAVKEDS